MSYDISLYVRGFLKRAIETELGDWRGADPIPPDAVECLVAIAGHAGFERLPPDPGFVGFLSAQGMSAAEEFLLDTPELLAKLSLHPGQLVFSIPDSPRAAPSIALCTKLARTIARDHDLAFHDPQDGVAPATS